MNVNLDFWNRYFNGKIYPLLVAVLIYLGHATGQEVLYGVCMFLTVIPACLICHNLRFAIMPFMATVFIISAKTYAPNDTGYAERYLKPAVLIPLAVIVISVLAALICFVWRNRRHRNPLPRSKMFIALSIFCVTLLTNGFFNRTYTLKNLLFAFIMSVTLVFVYLFFSLYLDIDRDMTEHFMYCLALTGLLICAELITVYFTTVRFIDGEIVKGSVVLGWGVWTTIGGMLVFLLPSHFYFAASHKYGWLGLIGGFLQYVCIVLSQSRGALLMGTLVLALSLLYLLLRGRNRKQNRIVILCTFLVGCAGVFLLREKLVSLVQNFLQMGFSDNGRFALWSAGIRDFLAHPVFGSGFYACYVPEVHGAWDMPVYPYLYHNTVVQLLGSCGLVGLAAYLYHCFCTVRLTVKKPTSEKTFLGLCALGLTVFSLTDVLFFKTYPTIIYALILLFMEQCAKIEEN